MKYPSNIVATTVPLSKEEMSIRGGSRTAAASKMERFVIIVNGFQPLTIITKRSILDVAAVLDPPLSINSEIQKIKSKKVIVNTDKTRLFTRSKKDGSQRMILNLKNFNKFTCYRHFETKSIQNVLTVIKKDAFIASIDLKDVFYSVPVAAHHQKYLKFLQMSIISLHACQMGMFLS